jgi:hypothetical protein
LELEGRYAAAKLLSEKFIAHEEKTEWYATRKLQMRTLPLGVDTLGNTYHVFIQRDREEEDWGEWIVVERAENIPHPSGVLPPPPTVPSDNGVDEDAPEVPQPEDETIRKRIWYAVSGKHDVKQLAEWIKFMGEMAIYEQDVANQQPITPESSVPASPNRAGKNVLIEVRVPGRKNNNNGSLKSEKQHVFRGDYMPLVEKLRKISSFVDEAV